MVDSDQVTRRPSVEDTDVHAGASVTLGHLGGEGPGAAGGRHRCAQLSPGSCVAVVGAGRAVDSCQDAGEAGLADAAHTPGQAVLLVFLLLLVPPLVPVPGLLPLVTVSVGDVGLEIPATKVSPPAPVIAVP